MSQVLSLLISPGALCYRSLHAFHSCDLLISSSLCGCDPFGLLGFQRRDGDTKNTNVVTQNTLGEEEEASVIISDMGSQ